jgi:hypothetical protein
MWRAGQALCCVARQLLQFVDLPPARLDVIVELLRSFRQISRERVDWCRHLQILEDLTMTRDPSTAYREVPTRKCSCAKFSYVTKNASVDAAALIEPLQISVDSVLSKPGETVATECTKTCLWLLQLFQGSMQDASQKVRLG